MSDAGVWPRRLTLALLALFAVAAAPAALRNAALSVADAVAARDGLAAQRERRFGADYVRGIERLRAALPEDGSYLLFDAGTVEEGARNWVRYDLAPRRAVFGGHLAGLGRPERVRRRLRGKPPVCVVAFPGDRAPLAMTHDEFIDWLSRGGDAR